MALIDAAALAAILDEPGTRVFDASWYLPNDRRDADAEFEAGHLPGASRFDFDRVVADLDAALPHMLPQPDALQRHLRAHGINAGDRVVFYDGAGVFASPRAWWMLRAAGLDDVAVLDGGLPAWRDAGLPTVAGAAVAPAPGDVTVSPPGRWLARRDDVVAALDDPATVIVDARPRARFAGNEPEPRPGLRPGHMPGARSLPASELVDGGRLRPPARLRAVFDALAPGSARILCTCGSGVTAAIIALAATVAGRRDVAVYDGSWAEWGRPGPLPVVPGDA